MKTPEQMAEEYAEDWHKDCDYPEEILRHTKKATATVFLAGYKAGQEHPFQFQTKMWVDPIGPQNNGSALRSGCRRMSGKFLWFIAEKAFGTFTCHGMKAKNLVGQH